MDPTDVLVVLYLVLQSVPIDHYKKTKITKKGWWSQSFFKYCGVRGGVGCGDPYTCSLRNLL